MAKVSNSKKVDSKNQQKEQVKLKCTQFQMWCMQQKITQKEIRNKTYLSFGSINNMWHSGHSNDSTILLVSLVYKLDFNRLKKMVTTFIDINP